jgi:hypothetical protein
MVALGLSIDSLLAGLAAGPFLTSRRQFALAAALGVADGWATFVAGAGQRTLYELTAVFALALVAAIVGAPRRRWWYALPIVLSIDNLLLPLRASDAPAAAFASAILAGLGICASSALLRRLPPPLQRRVALGIASAALVAFIGQ